MLAEFEERTFENASNAEFSYCYRFGRVYSFGQVQEGRIGLDSALYLEEDYYVILIDRALDFLSGAFSLRRDDHYQLAQIVSDGYFSYHQQLYL